MTAPFPALTGAEPCATGDPERFHPDNGQADSRALCGGCPAVEACLAYALTVRVTGIWGATTVAQRDRIRNAQGIVPAPLSFGETTPRRSRRELMPHGTYGAVSRHRADGEPVCWECRAFEARKRQEKKQQKAVAS